MQGALREDVWSNKDWYQDSGFKGQQGSDMNVTQAWQPPTFFQKRLRGAVQLLYSSFCRTPPNPHHLPSAQVHYVHLFQCCYKSLHINCYFPPLWSIHSLSLPSIHGPDRAIDSLPGHDRIVFKCEAEKKRRLKGRVTGGQHGSTDTQGEHWTDFRRFCGMFWSFKQLIQHVKRTPHWFDTNYPPTVSRSIFHIMSHGKRFYFLDEHPFITC